MCGHRLGLRRLDRLHFDRLRNRQQQGDGTEQCDDGNTQWAAGESCDATCMRLMCGDPDDTGTIRSSDALFILRTAVGTESCDDCVCNVDSSAGASTITASDSLRTLRKAVGISVELVCPACS